MSDQTSKKKPQTRKELMDHYELSYKQLTDWLSRHPDILAEVKGKQRFTPAQIDRFIDLFGEP